MAAAPPPAKLKACLDQVKERVLSSDSSDPSFVYSALIATELLQRGVLPSLGSWNDELLEMVRSTAGRPLLNEASLLPMPLLTGASAMAGMVAERCLSLNGGLPPSVEKSKEWDDSLARCRVVDDYRLATLLQLPFFEEENEAEPREWKLRLLHIAEGYFLRAASFQPDPPQMWKRSLDVMLQRRSLEFTNVHGENPPPEATFSIKHLVHILEFKGNEKRVSELSLKLAESWLAPKMQISSFQQNLRDVFCIPYRPKEDDIDLVKCSTRSRKALEKCNPEMLQSSNDESLRYEIISLRIELSQEEALIDTLAAEKHTFAKNRSQAGLSLETCRKLARKEILERGTESQGKQDPIGEKANILLDSIQSVLSIDMRNSHLESAALELIQQHIERLIDISQANGLASHGKKPKCTLQDVSGSWSTVATFATRILRRLEEISGASKDDNKKRDLTGLVKSLSLSARNLVEAAAVANTCVSWMTSGDNKTCMETMGFVSNILSTHLQIAIAEKVERERLSADVVTSDAKENESPIRKLECANAAALAVVALAEMGEDFTSRSVGLIQTVTDQALIMSMKPDRYESYQGIFGVSFLQFLVCWSGLHRSAWPFCNVTQARVIVNRASMCATQTMAGWGRRILCLEDMLLDLGRADAEGGLLVGGFANEAKTLFQNVHEQLIKKKFTEGHVLNDAPGVLLKTHCLNGLSRIALSRGATGAEAVESFARDSLDDIELLRTRTSSISLFYMWTFSNALSASISFHVSVARQLVADSLLRASRPGDARSFLEDAVRDAPLDYDAAFSLGAFLLRLVCFCESEHAQDSSVIEEKRAQTQLMKSAKLDSKKGDPFALLGLWYEKNGDIKRAIGCYSRALLLEPPHPVAGRGILRLRPFNDVKKVCDAASNTNSPLNGWAWGALGGAKAMIDGDDDLAILCFQKALRCRDIECPRNESLGVFYASPPPPGTLKVLDFPDDLSSVWTDLAGCYRRLGRYSASLRAFASASEVAGENLPSPVLCSWAQVELELGLHEEAADKFATVLVRHNTISHQQAAYGQGSALLALAQTDARDGKAGAAFEHLNRAIDGIMGSLVKRDSNSLLSSFTCALKLLGDLYSFGAWLPPDVFTGESEGGASRKNDIENTVRSQIAFIARGEEVYRAAEQAQGEGKGNGDMEVLRAAAICDLGTNIQLQAQILSSLHGEGNGDRDECSVHDVIKRVPEVRDAFNSAAETFHRAVELNPLYAPAWSGLGCTVLDPLLQQHAFCRALQLNRTAPEIWSNLGFLYARHQSLDASAAMMDALTQVADTPSMWIGRALILERKAWRSDSTSTDEKEERLEVMLSNAADAYRAALQVKKEPNALLGLALNCRIMLDGNRYNTDSYGAISEEIARAQSYGYLSEFSRSTGEVNTGAAMLQGVLTMEDGVVRGTALYGSNSEDTIKQGTEIIDSRHQQVHETGPSGIRFDLLEQLSIESASSVPDTTHEITPPQLSQARQIVHDPYNGKLWLDLAKNLVEELVSIAATGSPKRKIVRSMLESATLAADRSATFLTNQLAKAKQVTPHWQSGASIDGSSDQENSVTQLKSSVPSIVIAHDISESLALSYCVGKIGSELDEKNKTTSQNNFDLQRALMMCPDNALARGALRMASA